MDYYELTADFDNHRTGLRIHLEGVHGISPLATCTPVRDIVTHLEIHHEPGIEPDEFFPYGDKI